MKQFSIEEALKFGWETTKTNFTFLIKVMLIVTAVFILGSFVKDSLKDIPLLGLIANIIDLIVNIVLGIGLIKVSLNLVSKKSATLNDLYDHYPLFWKYLGGSILTWLIISVGLILLVIPGIIFAIRLQFTLYLIVDKNLGPIEAMQQSWEMTKGSDWNLFLLGLLLGLIIALGAILLLIGLLWAIPTTAIANAFVYKKLLKS